MKQERLEDKFEKLYQTFTNSNFLSMNSIGGEIPFYISSYTPAQEVNVFSEIERLINRLKINAPKTGNIRLLQVTENQYNNIIMFSGTKKVEEDISMESLLVFE